MLTKLLESLGQWEREAMLAAVGFLNLFYSHSARMRKRGLGSHCWGL